MDTKHLERIGKMLRQAESALKASSEEEAQAFIAKAQALATQHAIDLEVARQHVADKTKRKVPTMRQITIGQRGKRLLHTYVELYLAIAAANDVTCDIAHNSTYVIAYGFETDIDVVDALYASLVVQMVEASNAYLRKGEYREEEVLSYSTWEYKPISGITARKSFQQAFGRRVGVRLLEAAKKAIEAAKAAEAESKITQQLADDYVIPESTTSGTELVLVQKEVEIKSFYKSKTKARGSYRGGRSTRDSQSSHARSAGNEAGARARLGGEKAIGGGSRALR